MLKLVKTRACCIGKTFVVLNRILKPEALSLCFEKQSYHKELFENCRVKDNKILAWIQSNNFLYLFRVNRALKWICHLSSCFASASAATAWQGGLIDWRRRTCVVRPRFDAQPGENISESLMLCSVSSRTVTTRRAKVVSAAAAVMLEEKNYLSDFENVDRAWNKK